MKQKKHRKARKEFTQKVEHGPWQEENENQNENAEGQGQEEGEVFDDEDEEVESEEEEDDDDGEEEDEEDYEEDDEEAGIEGAQKEEVEEVLRKYIDVPVDRFRSATRKENLENDFDTVINLLQKLKILSITDIELKREIIRTLRRQAWSRDWTERTK